MKDLNIPLVLLIVLAAATTGRADSLWAKGAPYSAYLFVDSRARRPGDLLTIVVQESTDIEHKDSRSMDTETTTGGVFTLQASSTGNINTKTATADFEPTLSSTRKFDGKADYSSDRTIADRMTVVVMAVQPNGNLLIEGTRTRTVSGEERRMRVTGIVRPLDIGPGNIVLSQFIANFHVTYQGKGPETHFVDQNWLGRIMNCLWPF
jgi:flagellar L-ring protein precursor FlgH